RCQRTRRGAPDRSRGAARGQLRARVRRRRTPVPARPVRGLQRRPRAHGGGTAGAGGLGATGPPPSQSAGVAPARHAKNRVMPTASAPLLAALLLATPDAGVTDAGASTADAAAGVHAASAPVASAAKASARAEHEQAM